MQSFTATQCGHKEHPSVTKVVSKNQTLNKSDAPIAETAVLNPELDGFGLAHLQCNRVHDGKLGSQRAIDKKMETNPNRSVL